MADETKEKFLVRVVRPVFQAAYVEVEGVDEDDACDVALEAAENIPEEQWSGRYNPDDYCMDAHCVRSALTPEGYACSVLDFPLYGIMSTSHCSSRVDGHEEWMRYAQPMAVASEMSRWIESLEHTRGAYYCRAIETLEQIRKKWKGSDQKVVPLLPPQERKCDIELVEAALDALHLLNDVD